jgi:hypothetical protein
VIRILQTDHCLVLVVVSLTQSLIPRLGRLLPLHSPMWCAHRTDCLQSTPARGEESTCPRRTSQVASDSTTSAVLSADSPSATLLRSCRSRATSCHLSQPNNIPIAFGRRLNPTSTHPRTRGATVNHDTSRTHIRSSLWKSPAHGVSCPWLQRCWQLDRLRLQTITTLARKRPSFAMLSSPRVSTQ